MNLPGIPFEVILAVLFFVVPLLGQVLGRLRRGRGAGSDPEQNSPPRTGRPTTEADTGTLNIPTSTATSTPTPNRPTDTARWLEEAQRRVREAQRAEDDRRSRGSVNPRTRPQTPVQTRSPNPAPTRSQPQPRPTLRPTPQPRPPEARSLETRSPEARSLEARRTDALSLETFGTEARSLETPGGGAALTLDTAPPMTVQRLGDDRRARMASPELRFGERELARGLIWHQILSPPLSQRRTRLSRPRL